MTNSSVARGTHQEQGRAFELDTHHVILIAAGLLKSNETAVGLGAAFTLVQDFAFDVEGITGEEGMCMSDFFVAEVGDDGSGREVIDRDADNEAHGEEAIHEGAFEFCFGGEIGIDVERLVIHGETAEENVIHFGQSAPEFVLDDFTDDEIFVIFSAHGCLRFTKDYHI